MEEEQPESPKKKQRAPRVPSPGAKRLTLTGILGATDDFGRVRLLLVERTRDGGWDDSWKRLREAIPPSSPGHQAPYELQGGLLRPADDDVRGVAHYMVPAHRRVHWLGVATELRGQWVRAEATLRPYVMAQGNGGRCAGVSLDLAMLEPLL
jgi:hypothetical protein